MIGHHAVQIQQKIAGMTQFKMYSVKTPVSFDLKHLQPLMNLLLEMEQIMMLSFLRIRVHGHRRLRMDMIL